MLTRQKTSTASEIARPHRPPRDDYRIAIFTNTYLPFVGGVTSSVRLYYEHLKRAGHDVLIYAPEYNEPCEDTEDVRRVYAIKGFNNTNFSVPLPGTVQPLRDFQEKEFDVVHVQHPFLLGETGLHMARSERIPLVFTYHTQYEQYTHYTPLNEETASKAIIRHATEFCNLCDLVIAPTRGIRQQLRKRGVTSRIEVLPSGIEMQRYAAAAPEKAREALGMSADQPLLLFVSRLAPEKNLDYLLDAVLPALEQLPGSVFAIAGQGPHEEAMKARVEESRAAKQVKFLGTVAGESLINLYSAATLFVFASKSETQGMVLVEAMAGGTPVVALDVEAMRDIVRDGVNGRLLPGLSTTEAYGAALLEALGDVERLARWRTEARATAEGFDMTTLVTRLQRHYRSLKLLPRHRLKREDMSFGLVRNYLGAFWEDLTEKMLPAVLGE